MGFLGLVVWGAKSIVLFYNFIYTKKIAFAA
jgi:O-antigen ligase